MARLLAVRYKQANAHTLYISAGPVVVPDEPNPPTPACTRTGLPIPPHLLCDTLHKGIGLFTHLIDCPCSII